MTKKEEILEKALKLFSEEGYDNVGVQKIADVCEIKKPTLYHYFGSKEGLLEALLEEKFTEFLEKLRELSIYKGDIVLSLDTVVYHYMSFARQNPLFYRLVLNLSFAPEHSLSYKNILNYTVKQYGCIESLFLEAEKQHGNMRGRSKMFAFTFIGIINASISYYFFSKNEEDLSFENAQKVCKQFRHGIFS